MNNQVQRAFWMGQKQTKQNKQKAQKPYEQENGSKF